MLGDIFLATRGLAVHLKRCVGGVMSSAESFRFRGRFRLHSAPLVKTSQPHNCACITYLCLVIAFQQLGSARGSTVRPRGSTCTQSSATPPIA